MLKRLLVGILVILFYLIWLPIALIKDIFTIFYLPFDVNRMFKTYQQFMNNMYSMANFHTQLEEKADEIGKSQESTLYRTSNIGFSTEEIEEEYECEEIEEE